MATYIIRRLLAAIPSLFVVSLVIFGILRLIPGDVVMARLSENGHATEEDLARMRAELGLDEPFLTQYFEWTTNLLRGDFGQSLWTNADVFPTIVDHMWVSIEIALMSMAIAATLAISLGVISAVKRDSWVDYSARVFSILGLSLPDFWLGTMLLLFLSLYVGWLPVFGWFPPWEDPWKNFQALIFPALIVGYRFSAVGARMTRSTMLEVLNEDYVRTARAKGLRDRTVVAKHVMRNAIIPVITIMGTQLSFMLGGLVIVEQIFSLPGMGRLVFDAITVRDYPIVQGTVMVMAVIFMSVNLLVDLSYVVIDPRIRYS